MSAFHLSVADNVGNLRDWHTNKHLDSDWTTCPHEPCAILETGFRKAWSKP